MILIAQTENLPIIKEQKKRISELNKIEIENLKRIQRKLNEEKRKKEKFHQKKKAREGTMKNSLKRFRQINQMPRFRPITKQMIERFNNDN